MISGMGGEFQLKINMGIDNLPFLPKSTKNMRKIADRPLNYIEFMLYKE
jgi:hypothetical protein